MSEKPATCLMPCITCGVEVCVRADEDPALAECSDCAISRMDSEDAAAERWDEGDL